MRQSSYYASITNYKPIRNIIIAIYIDNGELTAFGADAHEGIGAGIVWQKWYD